MPKPEQLSSAIDRAVREVFSRGFNDPRISGLLTIIAVKVSQDGREAFVDVSVLPGEKGALSIHGLNAAAAHIRREVGERIRVRAMPQLTFRLDESLKKQLKVLSALDKVREEMAAKGELPAPSPNTPDPAAPDPDSAAIPSEAGSPENPSSEVQKPRKDWEARP